MPVRTTFEFTSVPEWSPARPYSDLKTLAVDILPNGSGSRAEARIRNEYVNTIISDIDAYIVIYDTDGNRIGFSKTRIESIAPGETEVLHFTWPEPFSKDAVKTEVLFSGSIR